jgi:predicted transcriptional regulator
MPPFGIKMLFSVIPLYSLLSKTMRYRSRTEIITQILEAVTRSSSDGGITKTKLMYNAFLSNVQLKEYLMMLTENHLLGYDPAMRKFKITEKGLRFIEIYNHISALTSTSQQYTNYDGTSK